MSQDKIYDLVIIGGGPGGLTAAIYAMRAALSTVLIEKGAAGGQVVMSDRVENYPGFEDISGFDLSDKFFQHAAAYNPEILREAVSAVEPGLDHHAVVLESGARFNAHAVILATGGSPRNLDIPGEKEHYGKGVSYCATCDGFFFRGKTVAVIGGGDTAVEEALYLAKITKKVYLIHRRDALRASRILQQRAMNDCNIEILWNTIPLEIKADEQGVCAITLQNVQSKEKRDLEVEGAFIFVGFTPNNSLVPNGVKMNADGYVITDEKCETHIPGIFAVGDLREKYARQIVIAAGDGCTAALAAAHYVEMRKASEAICTMPQNPAV